MSTLVIPLRAGDPFFEVRVSLSGREFVLAFNWNDREKAWFCDLYTSARAPVRTSMRVSVGNVLLRSLTYSTDRPPGDLIVIDTTTSGLDPTLDDLGTRVLLVYDDTFPVVI